MSYKALFNNSVHGHYTMYIIFMIHYTRMLTIQLLCEGNIKREEKLFCCNIVVVFSAEYSAQLRNVNAGEDL